MLMPKVLLTARHAHPNVRTAEDYLARQRETLEEGRRLYPHLVWPDPFRSHDTPLAFVSGGCWKVECTTPGCRNYPMVAPEWDGLACCYECGAIYEGVSLPPEAEAIEAILVERQEIGRRYWAPGMTVFDLLAQDMET